MKKVLIIFPYVHLPYSPTTLNLFYMLKRKACDVRLITVPPSGDYSLRKLDVEGIEYMEIPPDPVKPPAVRLMEKIALQLKKRTNPSGYAESLKTGSMMNVAAKAFIRELTNRQYDEIIAVDFFALWCVRQAGLSAHLLSLEITENDVYRKEADLSKIKSVIIQSRERYDYLFEGAGPACYFVQNSPLCREISIEPDKRDPFHIVYCGSALSDFGFVSCLDFLNDFPEYKLTVVGAVPPAMAGVIDRFYSNLVTCRRLIIDDNFYDAEELADFLSAFRVGLVFYDFYRFKEMDRFNYHTAPSGKLFQYFNAGLPVVGNYLPGFSVVEEQKAGVLVPYISSLQIKRALDIIENDYSGFAGNAKIVSRLADSRAPLNDFIERAILGI